MEIKKDINTEYNVIAGFWKVVSNNYCGNGKYELIVNGWKNKASSTGKFLPLNLNKQMKNMFVSFVFLLFCSNVFAFNFDWDNFGSQSIFYRFSEHLTSSSDDSPVLTSTITLVPTGIGYTGDIPGATGADFAPSSAGGSPSFVFKVSHTGNLNFTVNMIYAVSATIAIEYRKATSGSWTVIDSYSTDYEEYFGRGGTISDIAGYAEIRLTITDYNGFGDVSYASFVFTPQ